MNTTINLLGVFDGGPQPVTTDTGWQTVAKIQPRGRRILASVVVAGQTIGGFQILQSAYPDDPNPQVIATDAGFNSPALANESYIIPAMAIPLAAGAVFQVHLQGDAAELIFQAKTAGGSNATVQVKGTANGASNT